MGRFKLIESPERMWAFFNQYREWVKANPILIEDYVGKDAERVMREKPRPLTMEGFENWLFENQVIESVDQYFSNERDAYNDFTGICRTIRRIIRQDQIEGGLANIYNPSITQRLNGLVDKTESRVIQEQPLFPDNE